VPERKKWARLPEMGKENGGGPMNVVNKGLGEWKEGVVCDGLEWENESLRMMIGRVCHPLHHPRR